MSKEHKDNPLIFKEKPYYTRDEQELYYRIAIDESLKQGNDTLAAHYKILLELFLKNKDEPDPLHELIVNRHKRNSASEET